MSASWRPTRSVFVTPAPRAGQAPAAPAIDQARMAPGHRRTDRLAVLALTPFPSLAANTRFRLDQFLGPLAAEGVDVTVRPFLDAETFVLLADRGTRVRSALGLLRGVARRVGDLLRARHADVVLVLREAMLAGPPVVEVLATSIGRAPLVLDLDDPTWVAYDSPVHGRLATRLRWPSKASRLIDRAATVLCASRHIAEFVAQRGGTAVLAPPVVDTTTFCPAPRTSAAATVPVVGWIGSHSTYPYLERVLPALAAAGRDHPLRLRVIGAGRPPRDVPDIEVEWHDWSLDDEASEIAGFDVGLYPLPPDDAWAAGKAGLKSVLYMACGVPFVAAPVGGAAELGVPGTTHLVAGTQDEWRSAVGSLVADAGRRVEMGTAGRRRALAHHTVPPAAAVLARVLREAVR